MTVASVYIDGRWDIGRGEPVDSVDPATETLLARWNQADTDQVVAAVTAARRSFDSEVWRATAPARRAEVLRRIADLIDERADDLADLVVREVGSPITLTRALQVGQPAVNFRWFADAAERGPRGGYRERLPGIRGPVSSESVLVREPIGVVSAIVPYNYPLNMVSWKVAPALAAGCSVVLLPSPRGALTALEFMRIADEAGLPPGVLGLVLGGPEAGAVLSSHPDVDMVSFTGSSAVGSAVMAQAAATHKKVVLELGGKSPNILLPSADLDAVVGPSVLRFCRNARQGCGATTRILVPEDRLDDFLARAAAFIDEFVPTGDPFDERTEVGPLISAEHLARVHGYLDRAVAAGGRVAVTGDRPAGPGWFLPPTLVTGVCNDAEICREELFAPVAVVLPYRTVDEAVAIANDSPYGLNASVFGDHDEASAVAERLDSGTVAINGGGPMRPDVPWGGSKSSGTGVEMGEDGFAEFFRIKHLNWQVTS
ncbi:aldehyde dehydrogenase (NAD+)/betaine-aldehyde dehydrogenase [Rhodococcus rhodochrous J38]|uniref:aldehyde dehydrogenase family protein n=1 Tax=Rhodococcus rhodochrous TaxID=1829 RepID=UPI00119D506C|nr:aldehyde dehydrogenase family protein [Rhodococcus rhodochrous]TWH62161.1 aldehyde dehydrogenase (NAD+)/betaine-aldehyde dehydrogenase [Rhodococcus rhodochrous J38]